MITHCSKSYLKKEQRVALISKRNPSLYLGGRVQVCKDKFDFYHVGKHQFQEAGVEFKQWESLFKKIHENLNNQ